MILNSLAFTHSATAPTGVNDSNRTMTAGTVISAPDGRRQFYFNLSGILNFNSSFTSPGPHSVVFCANDTFNRITCTNRSDFIIKGMNITQMERVFTTMQQGGADGLGFGGLNITLGNGTEIPEGTFMNPIDGVTVGGLIHKNFTFIFNFSNTILVHIVGGRVDESQFANASNSRVNNTPTPEVQQQVGRYTQTMAWADIASFIPSEVSYEYGMIQIGGTYGKMMYCNGTSMATPSCQAITECNSTVFGILNHTLAIPTNKACWLTAGTINTVSLASEFTYMFVDHFSGGLGANDYGPPNVTFVAPAATEANHRLNRSTTVTQLINFTVEDTDSTGLNLTANNSINVTITLGGSQVAHFSFLNVSTTNLTCTSADTVSTQNTTRITCNVTYGFNSNGTYLINITGRDTSNNSNAMNTTSNYIYFTVDQIPPIFVYYNFTNSSAFNTVGGADSGVYGLGVGGGASRAQGGGVSGTIYAVANWTDNLTNANIGLLQFYNTSKAAGQEWQTINTTAVNGTDGTSKNGGWTNFSFPIPQGHNEFEGKNVSFRIITNDTVGNVNDSASVKNFTIQINDTTLPTLRVT